MLEYVVRPFQSPQLQGAIIIPSTPAAPGGKAILTWGAKTTVPGVNPTGLNVVCCNEISTEKTRKTEKVKVTSTADPTAFIMLERATELSLNKKEKNDCAGDWDQFSGVGAAIDAAFTDFAADFSSGTASGDSTPTQCQQTLKLSNNTTGSAGASTASGP